MDYKFVWITLQWSQPIQPGHPVDHKYHIWLQIPFLCDVGIWIAFLIMIFAQFALKFTLLLKFHHFTFLPTLRSTAENTASSHCWKLHNGRHTAYWNFNLTTPQYTRRFLRSDGELAMLVSELKVVWAHECVKCSVLITHACP